MKNICLPVTALLAFSFLSAMCQNDRSRSHMLVFYNVENLFDTRDDTLTLDDEFTPSGQKHWTRTRYIRKLRMLADVIEKAGGRESPLIVGLAEVENRRVVEDLVTRTGLADTPYGIVHQDSPDARGIDVALLYRKDRMHLVETAFHPVSFLPRSGLSTRDILYAKGLVAADTFHFFVCHFPSMRGGERQSEWKRIRAASVLESKVDSLFALDQCSRIVIMGDFNGKADTPAQKRLGSRKPGPRVRDGILYNTGWHLLGCSYKGSYRYRGNWQTIDHILVSGSLLKGTEGWRTDSRVEVFAPPSLLERDDRHYGFRPKPTYRGFRYNGGCSDHLPLRIRLWQTDINEY